ncbi:MAG: IPT/TIG domain-containing protein, partial [Actinobacteria bacterium]|nr:IPT/TIG domain-containing protein [Actinomycetota bacterium]
VLWKGGTYDEESGWVPVFAELQSNGGDASDHGSAPRTIHIRNVAPRLVPGEDPDTCRPSDLELNSLVVTTGEALKPQDTDLVYSTERRYREIDLEVLYFNHSTDPTQNCDRDGPALLLGPFGGDYHQSGSGTVEWAVPATDPSGVWRVLVVATDNLVDGNGRGAWQATELTDDGGGTFRGSRAFAGTSRVTYVIQAVDRRGNVTWLDYVGAQLPASDVPLGIPRPVDVAVVGTPTGPVVSGFSPSQGPVASPVTVTGSGFTGATSVTFNGTPAGFTVTTDSSISTTVPVGATTGPIAVTTPYGSHSSSQTFTVTQPPSLSITSVQVREGNAGQKNAVFT